MFTAKLALAIGILFVFGVAGIAIVKILTNSTKPTSKQTKKQK